jgi:hypothetical protein
VLLEDREKISKIEQRPLKNQADGHPKHTSLSASLLDNFSKLLEIFTKKIPKTYFLKFFCQQKSFLIPFKNF